jgi:hypothetical protein
MATSARNTTAAAVLLAAALLLAGCSGGSMSTPSAPPTAPPSGADYRLDVLPALLVGRAVPGQSVALLVSVSGSGSDAEVAITAEAPGASVSVSPEALSTGTVGEVTIVPEPVTAERAVEVVIKASLGGIERQATRTLTVSPGEDTLGPEAAVLMRRFSEWLAVERPDLGIGPDTRWEGTPGGWVLVVNHYQYFSETWELGLDWHVMVPPDDWARIYLRRRWTEATPSAAFEITSVSGTSVPREIEPPESVWR